MKVFERIEMLDKMVLNGDIFKLKPIEIRFWCDGVFRIIEEKHRGESSYEWVNTTRLCEEIEKDVSKIIELEQSIERRKNKVYKKIEQYKNSPR